MKDLRPFRYFLGIEVAYGPLAIYFLDKYIADVLTYATLIDSVTVDTPLQLHQNCHQRWVSH